MKNEIILYQPQELPEHIEVRIEEDTVWLNQAQLATLFNQTKQIKRTSKYFFSN